MVSPDDFSRDIARQVVAHACLALGVTSLPEGGIETLSELTLEYISQIGRLMRRIADRSGRAEVNLLDVLGALAALPRGQAVKWRELRDFAFADDDDGEEGEFAWDQPFHHSVPAFPATRPLPTELLDDEVVPKENQDDDQGSSTDEKRETRPHIPSYLPAFPPLHTYKSTSTVRKEQNDDEESGRKHIKRKREAEQALYRIMQPPPPTKSDPAGDGYKNGARGQPQHFGSLPELPRSFAKKPPRHTAQAKKNSLPHYQHEQGEHSSQLDRTKGDMILDGRYTGVDAREDKEEM